MNPTENLEQVTLTMLNIEVFQRAYQRRQGACIIMAKLAKEKDA